MQQTPIAIIGVSALFPGSVDAGGFWRDILAGRDLISDVPPSHWLIEDYYDPNPAAPDKTYCKRGAFLSPIDFPPMDFGVPPSIMPATDTAQLLALIVAQKLLEDVGESFQKVDRDRVSVILGVTSGQELLSSMVSRLQRPVWLKALRESGIAEPEAQGICDRIASNYVPWQEASFPGLLGNVVAGRVASRFDLHGTNCVTDAACASALSALSMAVNELALGHSDLVVTGGVDTMNDILMYMCFSKTPALSPTGDCRPFSDSADGTLLGEGLGMLALRRLEDAERDQNHIYAVIKGVGSSSDGRSKSIYAPLAAGQARALRRAYERAGYGPGTVELVEAHGTGTKAGDMAELEGLSEVFGAVDAKARPWCALGSIKSQIGHTKASAGVAGLVKAVLALHHKALPPTIKVDKPNAKLALDSSPFYINPEARPWIRDAAHPRRASVSSFGFGGSNFHVTLEEYTGTGQKPVRLQPSPTELALLSGPSVLALLERAKELLASVEKLGFAAAARASQRAFRASDATRLAVVASGVEDLRAKLAPLDLALTHAPQQAFSTPTGVHFEAGPSTGSLAFLFPGQGSQYVGMGSELALSFDAARAVWDELSNLRFDGVALPGVVFPPYAFDAAQRQAQQQRLTATEWAQPAIGATSVALLALLRRLGVEPACVAGHSFGEVTALYAAGALELEQLVALARKRGELMRDAASVPGGMVAVQLGTAEVASYLERVDGVVLANHNHPAQVVLSGPLTAIETLERELGAAAVHFTRLQVATAFHSPLVSSASAALARYLDGVPFQPLTVDVYSNAEANLYPREPEGARQRLAEQLARPVRFVDQVEAMWSSGVRTFVEVGPGMALTEFVGRILKGRPHRAMSTDRKGKHAVTSLQEALGRLALSGLTLDFGALWPEAAPAKAVDKPSRSIAISGANFGKPYPPPGGAAVLPPPVLPPPVLSAPERPSAPRESASSSAPARVAAGPAPAAPSTAARGVAGAGAARVSQPPTSVVVPSVASTTASPPVAAASATIPSAPSPALINGEAGKARNGHSQQRPPIDKTQSDGFADVARADSVQMAWVQVYQESQRALVDAQATYQRTMAESHAAFLRAVETSYTALATTTLATPTFETKLGGELGSNAFTTPDVQSKALGNGHGNGNGFSAVPYAPEPRPHVGRAIRSDSIEAPVELAPATAVETTAATTVEVPRPRPVAVPAASVPPPAMLPGMLPGMSPRLSPRMSVPPAAVDPAAVELQPAVIALDLEALLLAVVAEKTGYSSDMLGMHMELEADLGVDSIKRVEILSALRERAPGLPEVVASELASLRTLGEIVAYMRQQGDAAPVSAATVSPRAPGVSDSVPPAAPGGVPSAPSSGVQTRASTLDLEALLLAVVAEKTGYSSDMLGMHMELEADLGVDSIKRVEILSALRERAPGLPEVVASELASLRTLGEIVSYMRERGAPDAPAAHAEERVSYESPASRESAPAPVAAHEPGVVHRYVVHAASSDACGLALGGLVTAGRVVLTDEGSGVAPALARLLRERGVLAEVVEQIPEDADAILYLGGLRSISSIDEALAVNHEAFQVARVASKRLAARAGLWVTVQDTGGDFGLSGGDPLRSWTAGVAALARTAAREWPHATVKAIDLERAGRSPEMLACALCEELLSGGNQSDVGLHADGRRGVLRTVPRAAEAVGAPVDARSVLLVSGGARGVTAAALRALVAQTRARVVLLGRTPLDAEPEACRGVSDDAGIKRILLGMARAQGQAPSPLELGAQAARVLAAREVRATLEAIEAVDGQARYVCADVRDAAQLDAALTRVREQWGPVTGIVHGAGVLWDKRIAEKTPEQFARVFDTKVAGLRALLEATASDPLRLIVMFSSVSARTGNPGQSDYAMANEVLNAVACSERRRRPECVVKSIGWGPWEGGMVSPALKLLFEQRNVPLLSLADGARRFVDEVSASADEVVTVIGSALHERAREEEGALEVGALDTQALAPRALDVRVDRRSHAYLVDHAVGGKAVLPVVIAMDWCLRAARERFPDQYCIGVEDLKVLRGIKLDGFERDGDVFSIGFRPQNGAASSLPSVEIRGRGNTLHYSAALLLAGRELERQYLPQAPELALEPWGKPTIYDGHILFHGPRFQMIRSIEGISSQGIVGNLVGTRELGWSAGAWQLDPGLFDGALQLAGLWACHRLGGATLPMAVGRCRLHEPGLSEGAIRCVVHGRQVHHARAVADLTLSDGQGRLIAEFDGIENVLRPSEAGNLGRAHAV